MTLQYCEKIAYAASDEEKSVKSGIYAPFTMNGCAKMSQHDSYIFSSSIPLAANSLA